MTSSLGVLHLDDLVPVPDGSQSDATGPPLPVRTNGQWTVRVDDSVVNDAAAEIPVHALSGITPGSGKIPADGSMAEKEQAKVPVVSDDDSQAEMSVEGSVAESNWTSITAGQ